MAPAVGPGTRVVATDTGVSSLSRGPTSASGWPLAMALRAASSGAPPTMRTLLLLTVAVLLAAADPATAVLDELQAANRARADLAREEAAWTTERQRLSALIAATVADTARQEHEASSAEARRDAARTAIAALGSAADLEALRNRLAEAGASAASRLRAIAATVPPGVIALGDDTSFDAVVRVLEGAERAAAAVTVEVVTGTRDGRPEAVKLLRVAGAAAWWVSLDGRAAGTAVMSVAIEADAIRAALAQAEGRGQPSIVVLP